MVGKLSARAVATAKAGKYGDGDGLMLVVSATGAKSWLLRYTWQGKPKALGLGGVSTTSLAEAREKATEARKLAKSGIDPALAKAQARALPSFKKFADEYLAGKKGGFRNAKHFAQWEMTVDVYAAPLHNLPIDQIKTENVLECLKPIWLKIPETASRLRGRIEMILNAAQSLGHIPAERANPARLKGHLENLLANQPKRDDHHAALPYKELPAFITELRNREAMAAYALEFAILCGGRTGEIVGMTWDEVDLNEKLWTVPASRMKAGREHRVPLSTRAVEILETLAVAKTSDVVFASSRDKPLSNMAMLMLLKRMGRNGEEARKAGKHITPHGFRSTCRDWAGDCTAFPREIIETVLAHTIGNKAEAAYRRGDALDKRRQLMQSWADYCEGMRGSNVVAFGKSVA